jgi:hypothetical protein
MVPTPIVVLLFIATFLLVIWQYLQIDPKRRLLNLRFGLMVGAIAGAVGYPLFSFHSPDNRQASWMFLALALFWLATAYYLLRRMPPREEH